MSDQHARSFGAAADAYDRGRPSYPREAAVWLAGEEPLSVLELGAGTGKLTRTLVELGHDVHATEPDRAMLDVLERDLPDVRTSLAGAEEIPVPDRAYDVVVCAQAFHWFDLERALPEIARVLRPGGRLGLVWNQGDERIPWVRRLGRLLGDQAERPDPTAALVTSHLFGFVEDATFKHWQVIDRESVLDLAASRSSIAVLDDEAREARLDEVRAFYAEYGRGMDGMQLPYVTSCFRATVVERPPARTDTTAVATHVVDLDPAGAPEPSSAEEPPTDGSGPGMLLIDFR